MTLSPSLASTGHIGGMQSPQISGAGREEGKDYQRAADIEILESQSPFLQRTWLDRTWKFLATSGVELRGVQPVPERLRTDSEFNKVFTLWCTSLICPLPIVIGISSTLSIGMGLRDVALISVFFSLLLCIPPAYICTIAPKTGMRQMIQARYTFGIYPNLLVAILNMMTLAGYQIILLVTAGQTLAALASSRISQVVGIVITALCCMVVSFGGFQFIHHYARWAWIPALIAIVVTVGSGGKELQYQTPAQPLTAPTAITFISLIAGYMLSYSPIVGDVAVYLGPRPPSKRIFFYFWAGVCLPTILLIIVGAAIGGAVPNMPTWTTANAQNSAGGIFVAMLTPLGGFGTFVAVLLTFSIVGQVSPGFYFVSLNLQLVWPLFAKVPRIFFVVVITGVDIGVAIRAADSFYSALEDFLGVIGYWSAAFNGIILTEYLYFRRADPTTYDHAIWNNVKALPSGIPALISFIVPYGLVVPAMDEAWYLGPIAAHTGDLGFEFAFVVSVLCYLPLRALEIRWKGCLQGRSATAVIVEEEVANTTSKA